MRLLPPLLLVLVSLATPANAQPAPSTQRPTLIEGLPTTMGRRIVSTLRQSNHAMPRILGMAHETQQDGGEHVFLVYEVAEYEACVGAAPTPADGRVSCRDLLGRFAGCTDAKAAWITVAANPARVAPGTGGAIAIAWEAEIEVGCRVSQAIEVARRDADGDGRAELIVDLAGSRTAADFRTGTPMTGFTRKLAIYAESGTPQLELRLAEWGAEQVDMTSESRAARWTFRDANRDRKPDVVITWFDYEDAGGCTPDAGGWQPPNSPGECGGDPTESVLEYDPASDTWDETAYPR